MDKRATWGSETSILQAIICTNPLRVLLILLSSNVVWNEENVSFGGRISSQLFITSFNVY